MWVTSGVCTTRVCSSARSAPTFSNSRSPLAEQHRDDVELQLVDQPGAPGTAGRASAPPPSRDVLAAGGLAGLRQRRLDAVGDEVEGGAALHLERLALVVGEDEDRHVEGRVLAPPAVARTSSQGPGPPPNMLRPMITAPMFSIASSTIGAAGVDLAAARCRAPRARPSSLNTHSCSRIPPSPSGFSLALVGAGDVAVDRHRDFEPQLRHRSQPSPGPRRSRIERCRLAADRRAGAAAAARARRRGVHGVHPRRDLAAPSRDCDDADDRAGARLPLGARRSAPTCWAATGSSAFGAMAGRAPGAPSAASPAPSAAACRCSRSARNAAPEGPERKFAHFDGRGGSRRPRATGHLRDSMSASPRSRRCTGRCRRPLFPSPGTLRRRLLAVARTSTLPEARPVHPARLVGDRWLNLPTGSTGCARPARVERNGRLRRHRRLGLRSLALLLGFRLHGLFTPDGEPVALAASRPRSARRSSCLSGTGSAEPVTGAGLAPGSPRRSGPRSTIFRPARNAEPDGAVHRAPIAAFESIVWTCPWRHVRLHQLSGPTDWKFDAVPRAGVARPRSRRSHQAQAAITAAGVEPAEQDVEEVVLAGGDQGEAHRQRVEHQ